MLIKNTKIRAAGLKGAEREYLLKQIKDLELLKKDIKNIIKLLSEDGKNTKALAKKSLEDIINENLR